MKKKSAAALILLAGVMWGSSAIFVNLLSPLGFSPIQMLAMRATVASVFITVFMLVKNRRSFRVGASELLIFAGLALTLFASCFFYYTAIVMTSASTAVMLLGMYPVYVNLLSVLLFKERLTVIKISTVFAMLVGCFLVSGAIGGMKFDLIGIVIGAFSGVSYAAYVILVKVYTDKGISSSSANLYSFFLTSAIALSICDPVSLVNTAIDAGIVSLFLIIGIGVFTFIIPFVLNATALKELSAGTVSALCVMEPLSATVFSVLLFGESLDFPKIVGIILILGAVVILGMSETRDINNTQPLANEARLESKQ